MEMKEVFNRLTGIIKKYDQLAEKINDVINDKELADNFLALLRSSNNPENLIISLDNLISSLSSILSSSDRILNNNDLLALRSLICFYFFFFYLFIYLFIYLNSFYFYYLFL